MGTNEIHGRQNLKRGDEWRRGAPRPQHPNLRWVAARRNHCPAPIQLHMLPLTAAAGNCAAVSQPAPAPQLSAAAPPPPPPRVRSPPAGPPQPLQSATAASLLAVHAEPGVRPHSGRAAAAAAACAGVEGALRRGSAALRMLRSCRRAAAVTIGRGTCPRICATYILI